MDESENGNRRNRNYEPWELMNRICRKLKNDKM